MSTEQATRLDIYAQVIDRLLGLLQSELPPYTRPYKERGVPMNAVTKRVYKGSLAKRLSATPFRCHLFFTPTQIKKLGGSVRQGVLGIPVRKLSKEQLLYNWEQCTDIEMDEIPNGPCKEFAWLLQCDVIIEKMEGAPEVIYEADDAFYCSNEDCISIPVIVSFASVPAFYGTLFHQLMHAVRGPYRLDCVQECTAAPDSLEYAFEEIVAAIGSCIIAQYTGIADSLWLQSAAYIQIHSLRFVYNNEILVLAAAEAKQAAEYILQFQDEYPF